MWVVIAVAGCTNNSPQKSADLPKKSPLIDTQQEMSLLSGKVLETMDSGNYTYINIEKDGRNTWVAVPRITVAIGQEISVQPGMAMPNFESKTLNRTFKSIIFSGGVIGQQAKESMNVSSSRKPEIVSPPVDINVEKAPGTDAFTVAELYEKSTDLDTKRVVVKGQVVKFSPNIMGKNWIHIQDGSGNESEGTNDILFTSQDTLSVGDIVTLKGTLYKDKDFGSGYRFSAVVEEATVEK
jgi:hypothetical protein